MDDYLYNQERVKIKTVACDVCGRSFQPESLQKHKPICKKQASKKRKVFDSGRQRAAGSDVDYKKTKETMKIVTGEKPVNSPPKTHWREKHNDFIKTVRNARMISDAEAKGGPVPKMEYSAVPSDYVNCQYCGRNFNQSAAQRHIPFCENQSKRQKGNTSANQRGPANTRPGVFINGAGSGGVSRFQPMSPQRKVSAESSYSSSASSSSRAAVYVPNNGGGSHPDRRPIKYDAQNYYDQQISQEQGAYSMKNKQILAQKNNAQRNQGDQMLRTGRNYSNNELNNMARNRSGNSLNNRDGSLNRRTVGSQPQQNGMRSNVQQQYRGSGGMQQPPMNSKYCHECGTEFPVAWAKFCSNCGNTR